MKSGWVIFKLTLATDSWVISCEISFSWMSLNLTDKSTLVQVMAWCRQATSHYLNQCWTKSMSPYGITRPQWVNVMRKERLRQRKWDKKAVARYSSMSSMDSISVLPDSGEEEGLDTSECESSPVRKIPHKILWESHNKLLRISVVLPFLIVGIR